MRILAFSDIHRDLAACARLVEMGREADIVIGAGDFATAHRGLDQVMAALAPLADRAVWVPGNNETAEALRDATEGTGATVLHGEMAEVAGLAFLGLGGGIPPLPPLPWHSWDLTEVQAEGTLARFHACDLMVLHSPPRGVADVIAGTGPVGSLSLRAAIDRISPQLAVCGHIHDCWGQEGTVGTTRVVNLGPAGTWFDWPEIRGAT